MEVFNGPIDHAPWVSGSFPERRQALAEALVGVELGAWDERIVSWLAGWDGPTVVPIVSWLWRVRRVGGHCRRLSVPDDSCTPPEGRLLAPDWSVWHRP